MSVYDTTVAVVKVWATLQTTPPPTSRLEVLWAPTGAPFYPDACRKLIGMLLKAFPGNSQLNKNLQYTQIKDTTNNTTGNIDSVDDLGDAVLESLTSSEVVYLAPAVTSPKKAKNK